MSDDNQKDRSEVPKYTGHRDLAEPSDTTMTVNTDVLQQARDGLGDRQQAYLIVISGPHVGRMYKVNRDDITMGRSPTVDLQLNDVGVSRSHAKIICRGDSVFVKDLQSANGTYINGRRVRSDYQLQDGDKITLGTTTILKFTYHDKLDEDFQRQMFDAALRDDLTGAYNKKYMMNHLRSELSYALRHSTTLSLLMFDVDHFKDTNDTHGHLAGDRILGKLSQLAMDAIRSEDVFARYGGEEFAIICRGISIKQCARLADRIRRLVDETDFVYDGEHIPISISVGVSGVPSVAAETPEDLIGAADEALYAAKDAGRNQVMIKSS